MVTYVFVKLRVCVCSRSFAFRYRHAETEYEQKFSLSHGKDVRLLRVLFFSYYINAIYKYIFVVRYPCVHSVKYPFIVVFFLFLFSAMPSSLLHCLLAFERTNIKHQTALSRTYTAYKPLHHWNVKYNFSKTNTTTIDAKWSNWEAYMESAICHQPQSEQREYSFFPHFIMCDFSKSTIVATQNSYLCTIFKIDKVCVIEYLKLGFPARTHTDRGRER